MGITVELVDRREYDRNREIARNAAMPRIGWMFIQLSLQLALFTTIIGLDYQYPTDEIVTDDRGSRMYVCSDTDYCEGRQAAGHRGTESSAPHKETMHG